jgi:hypothetical protein
VRALAVKPPRLRRALTGLRGLTARRDRANPPSVPLTTQAEAPATVMYFYSGPLMQFYSGVDT